MIRAQDSTCHHAVADVMSSQKEEPTTDNRYLILIPPMKMKIRTLILAAAAIVNSAVGQDYQDYADGYEQDNLYENYAAKQQEKVDGGGG